MSLVCISAALVGGSHEQERGSLEALPRETDGVPPLLSRWARPPPQWLSRVPQIYRSRQYPSPSPLKLTLGFPGHLRGGDDSRV